MGGVLYTFFNSLALATTLSLFSFTITLGTRCDRRDATSINTRRNKLIKYLSQNAKRASARKDTGLDQSLFLQIQLFHFWIIKVVNIRAVMGF